jgi:hypothetical protein
MSIFLLPCIAFVHGIKSFFSLHVHVLLLLLDSGDQSDGECKPGLCDVEACLDRLNEMIQAISFRVGTMGKLNDMNSAQSNASAWMVQQCYSDPPIDPCNASLITLMEQRYALAVMYFSLGGDGWVYGSNPDLDPNAPPGQWMSSLNYCEWGAHQPWGSNQQLLCDEFGNVLKLNLCEFIFIYLLS